MAGDLILSEPTRAYNLQMNDHPHPHFIHKWLDFNAVHIPFRILHYK